MNESSNDSSSSVDSFSFISTDSISTIFSISFIKYVASALLLFYCGSCCQIDYFVGLAGIEHDSGDDTAVRFDDIVSDELLTCLFNLDPTGRLAEVDARVVTDADPSGDGTSDDLLFQVAAPGAFVR